MANVIRAREQERLGFESEFARLLLAVLPLFISNLRCFDHIPHAHYSTADEHDLKNLRSSIHFEIRILHVTMGRADAAFTDDAFVQCADVLKDLLDLLESLLRPNTVSYLTSLLDTPGKKTKQKWFLALTKPRRILSVFGSSSSATNQKLHPKLRSLCIFLQAHTPHGAEPGSSFQEDVDCIVKLPPMLEDLNDFLGEITRSNQLLELILSKNIPSLQMEPKRQVRRSRRMKSPEYRARNSGNNLYQALASRWPVCEVSHRASLRLTPYLSKWTPGFLGAQEAANFDMFLSTHSDPSSWQEVMFAVNKSDRKPAGSSQIEDLCDLIQSSQGTTTKPYVLLHQDQLLHTRLLNREQGTDSQPTLLLKDLLDGGHLEAGAKKFQLNDKRILAVILAHGLLQFAESPWMSGEWNSENIFFLHQPKDGKLPDIHRLYISAKFDDAQIPQSEHSPGEKKPITSQHAFFRHPSIIDLGVLLLEIETGETMRPAIEDCDPKTGRPNMYTAWTTAVKLLNSPEIRASVYQDFRSVIEACLEPQKFLPEGLGFNDVGFREKVYEMIVAPLEDELVKGWPDLEIESLGIQMDILWDARSDPTSLSLGGMHNPAAGSRHQKKSIRETPKSNLVTESRPAQEVPRMKVSFATDSSDAEVGIDASKRPHMSVSSWPSENLTFASDMSQHPWWRNFKRTQDFMHDYRRQALKAPYHKRVKVAILDTGYNTEDRLFRQARHSLAEGTEIEWKDFIDNSSRPIDESGHGTRVAFFLLQITNNVDLWIARVYKTNEGEAETPRIVKEAIDEAIELDVDIICMSLGFVESVDGIRQSILTANAKGILVFAAASNDRAYTSEYPITFPASMPWGVFCINSHCSKYKWSGFNPPHFDDRDNFCTIGEDLHGPDPLPTSSSDRAIIKARTFKGTSYSTPIAVGLAALILEYSRSCRPLREWRPIKDGTCEPLKTFEIMRAVFKKMCYRYVKNGPNPILPWILLEQRNDCEPWEKIKEAIRNEGI